MPSSFTPNYNLNQWEADDRVLRVDFNADNAKLDAALGAKAEQSVVTALQTAVNGKASQSALAALQTKVSAKAEQSVVNALQKKVDQIDARAGSDLIGEIELTEAKEYFGFDTYGLDWSKYSVLVLTIEPVLSGSNTIYKSLCEMRMTKPSVTLLFPMFSAGSKIMGLCVYSASDIWPVFMDDTFQTGEGLWFSAMNGTFMPGTVARAVGIK